MNNERIDKLKAYGITPADYDDAGNQTLVKTSTGIWSVVYNAENRPTSFTNTHSGTIVECTYDYMGRRATKKVTVNGSVTLHQRFLYRGYLQIACCDLTRSNHPCLWLITWDPSQPVATRPLAIQKDGTWYTYGWDLTKNICEVYGQHGYIRTNYSYSPYGEVTISGDVTQPIQWSSEYADAELDLVYYNYRHYSPVDGRWLQRDFIHEYPNNQNAYIFVKNSAPFVSDFLGLIECSEDDKRIAKLAIEADEKDPLKGYEGITEFGGSLPVVGKVQWSLTSIVIDKAKGYVFECTECKRGFWRGLVHLWLCNKKREIKWTYNAILTYTTSFEINQIPELISQYTGDLGIAIKGNLAVKKEYKKITKELEFDCEDDE